MITILTNYLVLARQNPSSFPPPLHAVVKLTAPLEDKNFYFLTSAARDVETAKVLASNPVLEAIRKSKRAVIESLFKSSGGSVVDLCFTDDEIAKVERELEASADRQPLVRFVNQTLSPSGCYLGDTVDTGPQMLKRAWRSCASGINNAIRVYGAGEKGRSPEIDGISYEPKSLLFQAFLHNIYGVVIDDSTPNDLFFEDAMRLAVRLMAANRRDEPARFEPMEKGENRLAFEAAKRTDWSKFEYSLILVPGYGPEEPGVQLSPIGKLAIELAAKRYKKGLAPFIMVSGGFVHPKQTPYCEAFEMKRSLMRDFGIPERAILIEPHARHTTTNLRNAARIMYRYGFPFEKPALVTTNTFQASDIESKAFHDRCQRVFGYQPHQPLKRVSPFDVSFLPKIESLRIDPMDPLDP